MIRQEDHVVTDIRLSGNLAITNTTWILAIFRASEFDWLSSEQEFRRARELGPNAEDVFLNYALYYLIPTRRFDEAIAALKRAVEVNPLSPYPQFVLGYAYYANRQWALAIEHFQRAIELDADYYFAHQYIGFTNLQTGKLDEGVAACETASKILGTGHWSLAIPCVAYAKSGKINEARRLLKELSNAANNAYVPPSAFAWIYCSLGEIEKSLDWFEKAINEQDYLIIPTYAFPVYDPLRSHPRYKALIRKMNLEP